MLSDLTVYADGRFARYDEAKVGLLTHGLHYGTGCFEGVRGFWSERDEELYLLHVRDHYERLAQSAKILMITLPHSVDELTELTVDLVARNNFRSDIYIRPLTYKSAEEIGVRLHDVKDASRSSRCRSPSTSMLPRGCRVRSVRGADPTIPARRHAEKSLAPT